MKNRNIGVFAAIAAIAAMSLPHMALSQTKAIDKHGSMLFEGRPFLTNSSIYNSYDLDGSPLGLFDVAGGSPRFRVDGGYRYTGINDGSGNYLSGQSLLMGDPGRVYFQVFYGPDILSHKNSGNAASLPLHRFGFAVAAQGTSQAFRSSFIVDGYYGKQEWENGDNARVFMGAEKLRLDFGSQPHPLFRVGLFFGVIGGIDTLYIPGSDGDARDFAAQMNLPEFGANFDYGGEDMPFVRSNLSFSYAFSRFVNTSRPSKNFGSGNEFAILNDSLNIFWVSRGAVPIHGDSPLEITPGLLIGFTGNSGEMYTPDPDNNPITIGGARPNSPYSLNGFWFGIGAGFKGFTYGEAYAEYSLADMLLKCGSSYVGQAVKKSRTLHHASFGLSTNIHDYVDLPLSITPRIAYFASGSSGMATTSRLGLDPLNIVASNGSKGELYRPQDFLNGFERVSGITIGVDALALEERLNASFWATFLSSSVESADGGLEIGLRVGFDIK